MPLRNFVGAAGSLLALLGFAFLLWPVSTATPDGQPIACGNALAADYQAAEMRGAGIDLGNSLRDLRNGLGVNTSKDTQNALVQDCKASVGTNQLAGWGLLGVGVLAVIGAVTVQQQGPRAATP